MESKTIQDQMEQNITGQVYTGQRIRIIAKIEPLDNIIRLSQHIKGQVLWDFRKAYGNILDLLKVPIQEEALSTAAQYWDVSLRCFTGSDFQLAPTIEEYGEILRMPLQKDDSIYTYPGHLPTESGIAKVLGVSVNKIQITGPRQNKGIRRQFLEDQLEELAAKKEWKLFNQTFAMLMYGIILFPSSI